ncbi:MAG: UDP-N-acetylmuramoyl-L-alanine--D-glutamate ligase [Sedimentisphaerales bacterium]|nr:UDP-N-acetylmuramoyl-L-alanine--D-glutamate ligase [Sedimentisphaerales bacterium]
MDLSAFVGKEILVMGLGRFGGGVDAAQFAAKVATRVVVTDIAGGDRLRDSVEQLRELPNVEFHLGSHDPADFKRADVVVANPAVAPDNPYLDIARRHGRVVTSQVGIFFQLCPARIVGITGANGKSTTTALTAYLLANAPSPRPFRKVWLSGNIGQQPLLTILDRIASDDVAVLELSSFQIEQLAQVQRAPRISLLTNLTPNHLDRYGTFDAYCAAKEGIFRYQRHDDDAPAVSLFNAEDEVASQWFTRYREQPGRRCVPFRADDVDAQIRRAYRLPGRAYLSNLAGAMAIAASLGVGKDAVRACLPGFKALPHRLELVAEARGVRWYNDSKATTPPSAIVALEAFDCPEVLIAGGYDKHLPFDELGAKIVEKAKAAILIGQTTGKIAEAIHRASTTDQTTPIQFAASLPEAVELARQLAAPGDVVLLSPACASYDMFENYQQRGAQFAELARRVPA